MARWATVEETAEYLRMSKGTIYNMINKNTGLGPLFQKGAPKLLVDLDLIDKVVKNES